MKSVNRRMILLGATCAWAWSCATTPVSPSVPAEPLVDAFVIQNVRLYDGQKVWPSATVLVSGGRIAKVESTMIVPSGVTVIDGAGKTLLPGLIDSHAHVWGTPFLEQAAVFGVTTVLDMGCADPQRGENLKAQARAPKSTLADIRFAGYGVTSPGGHCTEYGMPVPTVSSPDDATKLVDDQIAAGADYIKIIYDDVRAFGLVMPTINKEVLKAAVDAAHRHKKMAIVHIGSQQGARDAVEVGADGLAHTFLDVAPNKDFGQFVAAHHAFVVPTLSVSSGAVGPPAGATLADDAALVPYLSVDAIKSLRTGFNLRPGFPAKYAVAEESVRVLKAAGVPILAGTDFPNTGTAPGVSIHGELELLVKAGLNPTEAMASATSTPASQFGLTDRGQIKNGLRADLLLVEGDPSSDIRASRRIVGVWRGGVPVDRRPVEKPVVGTTNVPEGLVSGLISNFDSVTTEANFGTGWAVSTDALYGGKSTAEFKAIAGGFNKSKGSLMVTGQVAAGQQFAWSGVIFSPGARPMAVADLSTKREIIFSTRGDGATYQLMVFAEGKKFAPISQPFVAGKDWKEYRFPFSAFDGLDGHDVAGIAFVGGPKPGKVQFQLDDVRLQ